MQKTKVTLSNTIAFATQGILHLIELPKKKTDEKKRERFFDSFAETK